MALTFQGLTSAGLLVLMTTFDSSWESYRGLLLELAPTKTILIFSFVIKCIMYLILLTLGWRSTTNFLNITEARGWNVSLLQNLLLMVESNSFKDEMQKLGFHNIYPLFSFLRGFQQTDPKVYKRGVGITLSSECMNFLSDMAEIAKNKNRHHFTRGYLRYEIYLVFYAFWAFSSLYFVAVIFNTLSNVTK